MDGNCLFAHFVIVQISADVSCCSYVVLAQMLRMAYLQKALLAMSLDYFKLIMLVSLLKSSLTCLNIPHPLRMSLLIRVNSTLTE